MLPAPVTYIFDFKQTNDSLRQFVMHEFAAAGAEHLVLTAGLLQRILSERSLAKTLQQEMSAEGLTFCDSHVMFGPFLDLCCPVAEARP